jgi:hypothetical protein
MFSFSRSPVLNAGVIDFICRGGGRPRSGHGIVETGFINRLLCSRLVIKAERRLSRSANNGASAAIVKRMRAGWLPWDTRHRSRRRIELPAY